MTELEPTTSEEPFTPKQAAAIAVGSALVTAASGAVLWNWDGWTSWIATPVFYLGFFMTLGSILGWYDTRHPSAPTRQHAFATAVLTVFFGAFAVWIAWLLLSPSSGCSDCSTAHGHLVAIALLTVFVGMTVVGVIQLAKLRRT